MTPLEVYITAGTSAGTRLLLERAVIRVGREADNDVVIDEPYVSRHHFELRFEQGRWRLVNHSPNGTRVNRVWVEDEPELIDDLASIAIGDEVVMEAAPAVGGAAASTGTAGDESGAVSASTDAGGAEPPGSGLSRRAKLWIGYFAAVFVVLGLLLLFRGGDTSDRTEAAPELSRSEIIELVRRDITPQPPDERRARAALREAHELFNRRDAEIDAHYRALEAYRVAWAYMPGHELEAIDRRRYRDLENELAELIADRYRDAYALLRSRQYEQALQAFRRLQQLYPVGPRDPLFENIQRHTAAARRAAS